MTYTTEQLIEFLETEFKAHAKGEREFVLSEDAEQQIAASGDPIGMIIGARNMASVDSYHSYRDQIHTYQRQHQVSGLVIESRAFPDGTVVRYPSQYYQLTLVDGDMDILRAAKDRVVEAFIKHVEVGHYYLAHRIEARNGAYWDMETTLGFIASFAEYMDWATLANYDDPGEVSLHLGYGSPKDGNYIYNRDAENWVFYAQSYCRNLKV
ncbi:hypothetical protein, partial [Adonisia turfae]|uniref:hypothetical protein n=1 Tax=Adonisia turfae TaxID=2950184 RepID=UPI002029A340